MQKDFLGFIKKHALIDNEDSTLLAVSGGIDSIVLTDLFAKQNLNFGIAHCNFQLRGNESEGDERHVRERAEVLGVAFHVKRFETKEYAKKHGVSTQMAARDLRYQWFSELQETFDYTKIATGHHKNDNVETVVHNFIRGTSISGMRGMIPKNGNVIRPMLDMSSTQIKDFAKAENLKWREDSSNESLNYKRNFIRHKILPSIEELNPNYERVMSLSMQKNLEVESIFLRKVEELKNKLVKKYDKGGYSISISMLKEEAVGAYVLSQVLREFGLNYDQCEGILAGEVGSQFRSGEYELTVDRENLLLERIKEVDDSDFWIDEGASKIGNSFEILIEEKGMDQLIETDSKVASFDRGKLQFPLHLRLWKQGDKFVPLGMKGKKKLSDFMIDLKIPLNLKQHQRVLLSGDDIIWVVGHRIDDRYKVTESTERIFSMTLTETNV